MASIIERNIVGLEALARVAAQKLVNIGFIVTHVDNACHQLSVSCLRESRTQCR